MKLEDLQTGVHVLGLASAPVRVESLTWHGNDALTLITRDEGGRLDERVLYRADESRLEVAPEEPAFRFDADGALFRLAAEAERIHLAHLYDPRLAVQTSDVEPLPHQITAVYEAMLPRQPLRFLLADDPGAGKTIMAGLLIRELIARGDVERCLVVCPGALVEQWQDELDQKFRLQFDILTKDKAETAASGNWFLETPFGIARLDMLSRNEELQSQIRARDCRYDLVICDEAHKMSAQYYGDEIKYTKRFQLGRLLSQKTRHLLLMTATPHSGIEANFSLFMSLLDEDRFAGKPGRHANEANWRVDASDLMRRMVKEKLLRFDSKPLFPERIAHTIPYELSGAEKELYEAVTSYVREEFNRADRVGSSGRRRTVGFALTVLQRRLASSPEAIHASLRRRRERLDAQREELESGGGKARRPDRIRHIAEDFLEDLDEFPEDEVEAEEERVLDQATAARTVEELQQEIAALRKLELRAQKVVQSGKDTKWSELRGLLDELFGGGPSRRTSARQRIAGLEALPPASESAPRKLVVFTEHRATLDALQARIETRFGRPQAVAMIHGGMDRRSRRESQERFLHDPQVRVLLATDAAGEGINLQRAHLMVNYDLPWNPNRLEQRFGRIHRIGQRETCHLWNLVAKDTREGAVYERLLEKLGQARQTLGGQVFDVLGNLAFEGKPLGELLIEAIRYGERPEARLHLERVVDDVVDTAHLRRLIREGALAGEVMDTSRVEAIRAEMERAEARRLQPHFIGSFFRHALDRAGGSLRGRETDRWQITHVPQAIREVGKAIASGRKKPVVRRYERVAFDKSRIQVDGKPSAEFLAPGHPLLDAVVRWTKERYGPVLRQGAVLVDDLDDGTEPRVVVTLSHEVREGRVDGDKPRVLSERMVTVEMDRDSIRGLGPAPYLDFRPLAPDEPAASELLSRPEFEWIGSSLQERARDHAIAAVVPDHFNEVTETRVELLRKTAAEVKKRLEREIAHWDRRAQELAAGKRADDPVARMNASQAQQTADELRRRMEARLRQLDEQRRISPASPTVTGAFVVVPRGLLDEIHGTGHQPAPPVDTQTSAARARRAVMAAERELGFEPVDRETEKLGYDIESFNPNTRRLRFIEVKGRIATAETVTVTRNEILTALNKPREFILALVLFHEDGREEVLYLKHPFSQEPDFGVTSVNYKLSELVARASPPV